MDVPLRLLLVALHIEVSPRAVPLGPAMLASALRQRLPGCVEAVVVDLYLTQSAEACADRLLAENPHAVGFSTYVWNRAHILEIAQILRKRRPSILLLAGGAEASADPDGLLTEGCLDLVLPGEGEHLLTEVVTELLQGRSPQDIQLNLRPAPVMDLSTLPSPILDGTLDPTQYGGMLWELSRGCPFKCDFCFESRGTEGTRRIPTARLEAELARFEAAGVSQIFVLDPTFNYDKVQAKEILRLIARVAPEIHYFFEIRSEFIDPELARLFASPRCTLQTGLQTADDAVLRHVNRRIQPRDFQAKILHLHRAGATYGFDLIFGLPGDTLQGFLDSLDFALGLAPNHLDLFPLSVLPGTRLQDTAPDFQLEHLKQAPYTVLSSPTFSAADMAEASRIARAGDLLYNEGKAVPWFSLLLGALDLAPSELIQRFADHLDTLSERPPLTPLLATFMAGQVEEPSEAAVVQDLVTWFGYVGELVEAASMATSATTPSEAAYRLHPLTRRVAFRRDPEALLEQLHFGITELEDLACVVLETPMEALLTVRAGEPVLCRLEAPEVAALQRLCGGHSLQPGDAELAERWVDEGLLLRGTLHG